MALTLPQSSSKFPFVPALATFALGFPGQYEDQIFNKRAQLKEKALKRLLHEDNENVLENSRELKQKVKDYIWRQSDLFNNGFIGMDKVKFGKAGWRERFYTKKISAQSPVEIEVIRKSVIKKYGEGLQWVLLYYFFGVPSWTCSHGLPAAFRGLMIDEDSIIIDFYPEDFETDIDGKRFTWQGVSKLPFIDEERLLTEAKKVENELKDTEKNRNLQTLDRLFVRFSSGMNQKSVLCCGNGVDSGKVKGRKKMDSTIAGIKCTLHLMPDDLIETEDDIECTTNDLCFFYEINRVAQLRPHLLEGVNIPEKVLRVNCA